MLHDLIRVDPKRTIDWGLGLVEVGGLEESEACEVLGHALQHGEIHTEGGEMSFELAETTNDVYEQGPWGFKSMQQELAAKLHAKGLIRTEKAPCQGFAYTHAVPYEIIEMIPPDSATDTGKKKGKGGG